MEKLELELTQLKQQLEESQRTIQKLDTSKTYLTEQLKTEKEKLANNEQQIEGLRASGKGTPCMFSHSHIHTLSHTLSLARSSRLLLPNRIESLPLLLVSFNRIEQNCNDRRL